MDHSKPSRRDLLRAGGALAAGTMLGGLWQTGQVGVGAALAADAPRADRKRSLRIAHITDVHVQPERGAGEGLAACLHHLQNQADKPDVIFNGGDSVMDSLSATDQRTTTQWNLWRDVLKNENSLPIEHCIGNHDIWGWGKKSGASEDNLKYGKKWALESFGLASPYRTFDRAGWRFIVLDSVQPSDHGLYLTRIGDEQFLWVADQLAKTPKETPVCFLSHVPILAGCVFLALNGHPNDTSWTVADSHLIFDLPRLKDLFGQHPNVRLCLSGHIHLVDRVDYNGVTYLCNGAVSGGWWKGKNQECEAGYALVNLFDDGSFEHRYVPYGWQTREA